MMKNRRGMVFLTVGLLLIVSALLLTAYNLWDESRALKEVNSLTTKLQQQMEREGTFIGEGAVSNDIEELPIYVQNPDMEMPIVTIDSREYIGILEIPALELVLPVINDLSYPALRKAPCRYDGSVYQDSLIIAAHNYQSHFGLLRNLEGGETVIFTDVADNAFYYEVVLTEALIPTAVEEMKDETWDLTLFTCTPGGQNRITVRCDRIGK